MFENVRMLVHLFPQALVAGLVIAGVCALLGVFVILKRVVFIGITLSEVAVCGIAAAMAFNIHPFIGASLLTLTAVAALSHPFEMKRVPRDAILGVVFVLASGLSILLVCKMGFGLREVRALLYGDLILTSTRDLTIILAALLPVLAAFILFLRPMLYTFLDREAAKVLGIWVVAWELFYFLALGLVVSAASKVAGVLLVFCYLAVAPSAALLLSRRLWLVMVLAAVVALLSTLLGLYWSLSYDLPTNPTIAVTTCGWFTLALLIAGIGRIISRRRPGRMASASPGRRGT